MWCVRAKTSYNCTICCACFCLATLLGYCPRPFRLHRPVSSGSLRTACRSNSATVGAIAHRRCTSAISLPAANTQIIVLQQQQTAARPTQTAPLLQSRAILEVASRRFLACETTQLFQMVIGRVTQRFATVHHHHHLPRRHHHHHHRQHPSNVRGGGLQCDSAVSFNLG